MTGVDLGMAARSTEFANENGGVADRWGNGGATLRDMRTYGEWQAERAANEAAVARIRRFLGRPYRRERPRDRVKAAVLREIGTAEALIGPVEGESLEDGLGDGQRVGA